MCQLFETIRVENGVPLHLKWHEERMNRSRGELWPGERPVILEPLLPVPPEYSVGLVRCNICYGRASE